MVTEREIAFCEWFKKRTYVKKDNMKNVHINETIRFGSAVL